MAKKKIITIRGKEFAPWADDIEEKDGFFTLSCTKKNGDKYEVIVNKQDVVSIEDVNFTQE